MRRNFRDRVLVLVAKIKRGQVLTYKVVARRAGSPLASRAAGQILAKNYNPRITCHRVIRSDGKLGGYNRGVAKKRRLLKEEGARIR